MNRIETKILIYCANCSLTTNRATFLSPSGRCESCDSASWDLLFVPQLRLSDRDSVISYRERINDAHLRQQRAESQAGQSLEG